MRMGKHFLLAAALVLLLSGCVSTPSDCANIAKSKYANCVYLKAVLGQDPFICYSLEDTNQRAICMRDASDSSARESLLRASPEQRALIFSGETPSLPVENQSSQAPPPQQNKSQPQGQCEGLSQQQRDDCIRNLAVEAKDMSSCEGISAPSVRQSCITTIARTVKNPEICLELSQKENIDLCNLYSKAGE